MSITNKELLEAIEGIPSAGCTTEMKAEHLTFSLNCKRFGRFLDSYHDVEKIPQKVAENKSTIGDHIDRHIESEKLYARRQLIVVTVGIALFSAFVALFVQYSNAKLMRELKKDKYGTVKPIISQIANNTRRLK